MSIMGDVEQVVRDAGADGAGFEEVAAALPDLTEQQVRKGLANLVLHRRLRRDGAAYHPTTPEDEDTTAQAAVMRELRSMGPGRRAKATELGKRIRDVKGTDIVVALTVLIRAGKVLRDDDGFLSLPTEAPPAAEPHHTPAAAEGSTEPVPDPVPPQARAEGAPAKGNGASPPGEEETPVLRFFDESLDTLRDAVHQALSAAGDGVPHVEDLGLKLTTLERLQVLVAPDIADVLKAVADDLRGLGRV